MEQRSFGLTGREVGVVGVGTWQFSDDWGDVSDARALSVLEAAVAGGVNLIDTADVYGNGRSEQLIGQFLKSVGGAEAAGLTVLTKMGRRADPHVAEAYTYDNFRAWLDRSRKNLGMDRIHLVQLHCPPTPVYSSEAVYDALRRLVDEGVIAAYGVSVETCDEALEAMKHGVASIQIICNVLRRKPVTVVLPAAAAAGVAVIARVPLASGILSGRFNADTVFPATDHRTYNRHGSSFDVGETFSGVPYEQAVEAGQAMVRVASQIEGQPAPAQVALRWLLDQPGLTAIIPGASRQEQAVANAAAADLPPLSPEVLAKLADIYNKYAAPYLAERW